ncbi:D-glycero-alpha-D-manno-heptose-1,7-bisphosphate 7-phosphatase [Magnetospirillum molischianum]|uniref:D,D-heptose 1,7-bisphosphate phosphatase n=1 Tax=Magnetospirillum molischianum DSM 120 TaxID=1150626 RepID=H8FT51_MAGML|nr:HAD family hydrolase [Magnetospirillum molischianum]CCG41539.1 Histidinol phosphatase and related phosphatase [Magnetospirillum molischianum DSM 120]
MPSSPPVCAGSKTMGRRFVLIDRDGTLNVEKHYLSDPDQLELYPGAAVAVRRLNELGLGVVVVTNQSGIARGYFDLTRLAEIHRRLDALLAAEGAHIDGLYLCPHGPNEACDCRKPRPGMIRQAVADHCFDPAQAFVIGDKEVDIELGHGVGAISFLVRTGHGMSAVETTRADYVVADLPAAVAEIERLIG